MKIKQVSMKCPVHGLNPVCIDFPHIKESSFRVCAQCFAEMLRLLIPYDLEVVISELDTTEKPPSEGGNR